MRDMVEGIAAFLAGRPQRVISAARRGIFYRRRAVSP